MSETPLPSNLRRRARLGVVVLLVQSACLAGTQPPAPQPTPSPTEQPPPPGKLVCETDTPTTSRTPARLLNRFELDNAVRDLFGLTDSDAPQASADFPLENRVSGFDNNAASHQVSPLMIDKLVQSAERVSTYVVERHLTRVLACDVAAVGEAGCLERLIDRVATRAFRRPLETAERTTLVNVATTLRANETFTDTVRLLLQVILQSPQFLYRLEPGELGADGRKLVPVRGYELATRLSFFLWASIPDAELLARAADGTLEDSIVYEAQVRRMLDDPRAHRVTTHFHRMWLKTEGLATTTKDVGTYPDYTPELRASWQASMDAWVEQAFWVDGKLGAFFRKPQLFTDARLAASLGLQKTSTRALERRDLDPTRYAGLLTQPALMAALALPNQSSPVKRGVFVRERLLCQTLAPPPPNVSIKPPDPAPGLSTRERFRVHTESQSCALCHLRIDPVGFLFERFDALGRYRERDNGLAVDDSGSLRYLRDPQLQQDLNGVVALSNVLADAEEVSDCVALEWMKYALGRDPTPQDTCSVVNVQSTFAASGGDFRELLVAITQTDAFRYRVADVE